MMRVEVDGVERVIASFEKRSLKGRKVIEGNVVYDAGHSVYVHEDLEAYHPHGQAKYLEQPARELKPQMDAIVLSSLVNKNGLEEGIARACKLLFDASQELVPVDTGELKKSGYIEIISPEDSVTDTQTRNTQHE